MKKIGKLSINPEKVITNDELVNLRGGYGGSGCTYLICADSSFQALCDYCIAPEADGWLVCEESCSGSAFSIEVENSPQCGC